MPLFRFNLSYSVCLKSVFVVNESLISGCFAGQVMMSHNDKSGDCRRAEKQIERGYLRADSFAGYDENDDFDRRSSGERTEAGQIRRKWQ